MNKIQEGMSKTVDLTPELFDRMLAHNPNLIREIKDRKGPFKFPASVLEDAVIVEGE